VVVVVPMQEDLADICLIQFPLSSLFVNVILRSSI